MSVYYRTLWTDDNDLLTTDFVAAKDDLYVRFTHKRNLAKVCSCFSRFYFNTTLLANAAKMEFYDTGKQEPYVSICAAWLYMWAALLNFMGDWSNIAVDHI